MVRCCCCFSPESAKNTLETYTTHRRKMRSYQRSWISSIQHAFGQKCIFIPRQQQRIELHSTHLSKTTTKPQRDVASEHTDCFGCCCCCAKIVCCMSPIIWSVVTACNACIHDDDASEHDVLIFSLADCKKKTLMNFELWAIFPMRRYYQETWQNLSLHCSLTSHITNTVIFCFLL